MTHPIIKRLDELTRVQAVVALAKKRLELADARRAVNRCRSQRRLGQGVYRLEEATALEVIRKLEAEGVICTTVSIKP